LLAARGCRLILAGRNLAELEKTAADLRIRHAAEADVVPFDALDFAGHEAFFARVLTCAAGSLDGVVAACGYLSDQRRSETDPEEMQRAIDVNFTSVVSLLNLAAVHLQQWAAGYIKGPNRKESAEDPRMKRSMRFLAHTGGLQSC